MEFNMKRTIIATLFSSAIIAIALVLSISLPTAAQSGPGEGSQDRAQGQMHEQCDIEAMDEMDGAMHDGRSMGQMHRSMDPGTIGEMHRSMDPSMIGDMHRSMHRGGSMGDMHRGGSMGPMNGPMMPSDDQGLQ
jgi:hypothetical protein